MDDSVIVKVIRHYYPDWSPPRDTGKDWIACKCPFHGDEQPSAAVSFRHNAFKCHACPAKGDAIAIIRQQEEVSFAEAQRIAEGVSPGSHGQVPGKPARKPSRRVFSDTGPGDLVYERTSRDRSVHARVRSRTPPWS